MELTYGKHSVENLLNTDGDIDRIYLFKDGSFNNIYSLAKEKGIEVRFVERRELDKLAEGVNHQGVIAISHGFQYTDLDEFLRENKKGFIVILDGITDPHNLGAIIRTSECTGVDLIIIPKRRSAYVNDTVRKVSSGATEYMKVAKVANINQTIKKLKDHGYWIYGADMDGETYYNVALERPLAIVIGSEGEGLQRLVKENLDFTISIPLKGKIESLNASVACGVILYEVLRRES